MYKYTITIKCTTIQAGLELTFYPVLELKTKIAVKSIIEQAIINQYIHDNRGLIKDIEVVRTSIERVRSVA